MELITLKKQFDEVAAAKGKGKLPVIAKYKDDELFKSTLDFIFNPLISTGLAKKKMSKKLGAVPMDDPADINDMFSYVTENNSGSDNIVRTVQSWILAQPEETHEFLKQVFINDVQIGASEKSINEAFGYEFIPVWEVMRGKKYDEHEHKVKGKFFITQKMDDYRTTIIWDEEESRWKFMTRQGQEFTGLVDLEPIFNELPKRLVYDGGLLSSDTSLSSKDRFRKTGSILRSDGDKHEVMFYIYDMLPKSEFLKGKSKLGYEQRQEEINQIFDFDTLEGCKYNNLIKKVPRLYEGEDKEVIWDLLDKALAAGHEGLMVNTADGKYETKRSDQLLKVKEFYTCDLRITGYKEYKHPNMLGAFKVDYKGNDCWVGFGFKKHERIEFWKNRDEMIGKIIEVKYFQESKNQNGGTSIRHGGFIGVRWDKNEVSYN